jgi:hypothetical protein
MGEQEFGPFGPFGTFGPLGPFGPTLIRRALAGCVERKSMLDPEPPSLCDMRSHILHESQRYSTTRNGTAARLVMRCAARNPEESADRTHLVDSLGSKHALLRRDEISISTPLSTRGQ